MSELRVGLVGAGVFAGYHAQKIAGAADNGVVLSGVYDLNPEAAQAVVDKVGAGQAVSDLDTLILASDAIMIATPAVTHAQYVARALRAGRHVFVEKPLALSVAEADALVALAESKDLVLQVGHQERFVFEAMGVIGAPGKPTYVEAVRESPRSPTGRCEDVSVVYDLMVHDIDLTNALFGGVGEVIGATGSVEHSDHLDQVEAKIVYEGGEALLRASRCAPERKRTMKLVYSEGEVEIDFLARTVRNETSFDVQLDVSETMPDPLKAADEAFFLAAMQKGASPIPGQAGARAVALAEAVELAVKAS